MHTIRTTEKKGTNTTHEDTKTSITKVQTPKSAMSE